MDKGGKKNVEGCVGLISYWDVNGRGIKDVMCRDLTVPEIIPAAIPSPVTTQIKNNHII